MPAMPWRLQRYMLLDVLRQFAITASVLVVVIAFGAAIKPLAHDSLLSPADAAWYIVLAIVPMLQFALPFAAAFAATMSLHRMTSDNEIIAMAVTGQSYLRILAPMAAMGVALTLLLAVLTQAVIPRFVSAMADSLTRDIPLLLARSVQQHSPFVQGDLVIWAEDLVTAPTRDGMERMVLDRVAVAKLDRSGRATMDMTAAAAVIDVVRGDDSTTLLVGTREAVSYSREADGTGMLRGTREGRLTHGIDLPSIVQQRPSALTASQLRALKDHPRRYEPVDHAADVLSRAVQRRRLWAQLDGWLAMDEPLVLAAATGSRVFRVASSGIQDGKLQGPVQVTLQRPGSTSDLLLPQRARLVIDQSDDGRVESITLQMGVVTITSADGMENVREELVVPGLLLSSLQDLPLLPRDVSSILEVADETPGADVERAAGRLQARMEAMRWQATSRILQRYAMSGSALLMVLLGSVLAIRLRDIPALSVYFWAFLPAVVDVLLIFTGGQMVRDGQMATGFGVMWGGNSLLVVLILFNWLQLRRT